MTRRITYANQLASSLFAMQDEVERMLEYGMLAQAILGTTTELDGFNCTANSPADMTVLLGQGSIFQYVDVDATAFGESPSQIPPDTTNQVLKFAYNIGKYQTTAFAPPGTPGFSRNDLIQISFSEVDGDNQNIPFWGGVTNTTIDGVSVPIPNPIVSNTKNVRRLCNVVIGIKQGTAAATGTQTTPAPDAGYVGAWIITTTNGQTTITSGNIARYPTGPFILEKLKDKISQAYADAHYAQISSIQSNTYLYAVDTGAANAYVATLSPAITSLTPGMVIYVKIINANTGASTINVNSIGVKNIKILGGYDPFAGEIAANMLAELYWDGTEFILLNPAKIGIVGSVYPSAGTSIPGTNTPTKVVFDTVSFDPCSLWDATNKRFILKRPGKWYVSSSVFSAGVPASTIVLISAYLNGSLYRRFAEDSSGGGDDTLAGQGFITTALTTDYIEIFQTVDGTGVTAGGGGATLSAFEIEYVGA